MPSPSFCPPSAANGGNRIFSYLSELRNLSPEDVRGLTIGLEATLGAAALNGSDTYTVPGDQDLIIFSMQGYLRFPTLNTEPTALLGWLNLEPSERMFVKAPNCLVKVENIDRRHNVMDHRDIPLGAVCPPVGAPIYFPPEAPFAIPSGHKLRGSFTLQDATTAIVGGNTVYGVLLTGVLLPKEGKK